MALRAPLRTSYGELRERPLLLLELEDGWGEAAPLEPYDGVPAERCLAALEAYLPIIRDWDAAQPGVRLVDACRQADPLPQALAAVDMALWDRAGRRAGKPVCELLTDAPEAFVHVNALADTAAEAAAAVRAGFSCVKAKAGLADDGERLAAIRAAIGPDVALRIDANGAWSVAEATERLAELELLGLELAEEPVHGVTELRALRDRTAVPLAMDETDAPGSGATAARLPEALARRRHRLAAREGRVLPGGRRGGLRRLDVRRAARDRRKRPLRGRLADRPALRARDARSARWHRPRAARASRARELAIRKAAAQWTLAAIPGGGSATGYGSETAKDFGDFIEKAETKALGRALIALGYGTQFAQEFGEDDAVETFPVRPADAVGTTPTRAAAPRAEPPRPRTATPGVPRRRRRYRPRRPRHAPRRRPPRRAPSRSPSMRRRPPRCVPSASRSRTARQPPYRRHRPSRSAPPTRMRTTRLSACRPARRKPPPRCRSRRAPASARASARPRPCRAPTPRPVPRPRAASGMLEDEDEEIDMANYGWTEFWSWARARGFNDRKSLDAVVGRATNGMTPLEIRKYIQAKQG